MRTVILQQAEPFDCIRKPRHQIICMRRSDKKADRVGAHLSQDRPRCAFVCWGEALPAQGAGTERYLTRFLCETRIHGLSWRERDQQPLV
jgi:hypothetical protein